jgi:putative protease
MGWDSAQAYNSLLIFMRGDRKAIQPLSTIELTMEPSYSKVGRIEHFYSKASVAVVELTAPLKQGDKIVVRGSTTNIEQIVDSMEIEHNKITSAQTGQRIGLKVAGHVRENDIVYKVEQA